jgi:hypothetical protein
MDPLTAVIAGVESIKKIASVAGMLKSIQRWIFTQPKEAAGELSRIVTELMKATPAVTKATDTLLDVFDNAKPSLSALSQVADGALYLEIRTIRPHCHDIDRIAKEYLWQWLDKPGVDGADAGELRRMLREVESADGDYLYGLETFAQGIQDLARAARDLAVQGRKDEAVALIGKAAPALFDIRAKAVQLALDLTEVQIEFRKRALGVLGG